MALALYRKYRPRTLAELAGHDTNALILKNAASAGQLGHAYLFYGSRGTGKTTTARILAKLFNCQKRRDDQKFAKEGEPCNECISCMQIDQGTFLDVIEIDAASNRGIDEIRNLKESINTSAAIGPYKVYIIDEAHMLTGAAFNALLKTLEEPPTHGVIILATTEYDKLPATIVSRTQRFLFKKLPKAVLIKKLSIISKEEKISIADDALELIAAAAEGSFRDAESLLDQVRSLGGKIDLAGVEQLTGRVGLQKVYQLAQLLASGDQKGALAYVTQLQEEGDNIVQLTKELIHYLRKAASLKVNSALEHAFSADLTTEELSQLKTLAAAIDTEKILALIKSLITAYSEMRYSPFASIPLEVVIMEQVK